MSAAEHAEIPARPTRPASGDLPSAAARLPRQRPDGQAHQGPDRDLVALLSRLGERRGHAAHRPGTCNALCTPECHDS